jgi:hypothetical protein
MSGHGENSATGKTDLRRKLRYPAISKALPHTTLDAGVKRWEFFLLYRNRLFAFIWGCEPSKSSKSR